MTALSTGHFGCYFGTGRWRDDTGASHAYRVTLVVTRVTGGVRVRFTHEFFEEPEAEDVHLDLTLTGDVPSLLGFELGPVRGRGYQTADVLHYDIPLPGNLVSATHIFAADGTCRVVGASEKNAAGRTIMWEEVLTRG